MCGPTGIGKTELALKIAEEFSWDIVSADSGQIYRHLDIGTAKPTLKEQSRAFFHLIDIRDPSERYSAADFVEDTTKLVHTLQNQGKKAVMAGGTGLYIRAYEQGMFEGPSANADVRRRLEQEGQELGWEEMKQRLFKIDPEAAQSITDNNRHRLIRALEVFELTGKPISQHWREHRENHQHKNWLKIGLRTTSETMYRRTEERIDQMIKQGWLEEVKTLMTDWGAGAEALKLIGYRECRNYLLKDKSFNYTHSWDDTVLEIKKNTRHYVKRQMTWFKKDATIRWVDNIDEGFFLIKSNILPC